MTIRPGRLILWSARCARRRCSSPGRFVRSRSRWTWRRCSVGPLRVTIDEEGMTRVRDRYVVSAPVAGRLERVELDPAIRLSQPTRCSRPSFQQPRRCSTRARVRRPTPRTKAAQAARDQARVALQRARDEVAFSRERARPADTRSRSSAASPASGWRPSNWMCARRKRRCKTASWRCKRPSTSSKRRARFCDRLPRRPPDTGAIHCCDPPIDGIVLRVLRRARRSVAAGTPLIEVGNSEQLEIVSDLLSTDAVKVQAGFAVLISWLGRRTRRMRGRVRLVEPAGFTKISALGVEEQRVNVVIDFEDVHDARSSAIAIVSKSASSSGSAARC